MRALRLAQCFEPVGNFVEAFVAGRFCHARLHVGVFVRFTGNGCFQVVSCAADGETGCRIAAFFEIFKVTVSVAGFTFGG